MESNHRDGPTGHKRAILPQSVELPRDRKVKYDLNPLIKIEVILNGHSSGGRTPDVTLMIQCKSTF